MQPNLAESWEISPDKLTYTFHLRHGVRWHDGQPFTADDVKWTYDKLMDPKVDAAPIRAYFTTVKSCEEVDPYTVRFTATEPYFKTLEVLGTFWPIMPKHVFEHGDPDFNKNEFGRHPIGTGPYKFVRWDTGSKIVLERNDDYWGGVIAYPKRLVYQTLEEPYVAGQLLKKGDIDLMGGVTAVQWEKQLKGSPSMKHLREQLYPYPAYSYFGFNLRDPLFADVRVRHAIDLLMPRPQILHEVYLDKYATLSSGYDPPLDPDYDHNVAPTPYDPAQARQLLAAAGWKDDHGDGILYKNGQRFSFSLLYPSGASTYNKLAELMQESLAHAGIEMKLEQLQFAQLIARTEDWKFDATLAGWSLDYNGDPWQIWNSADADVKKSSNFIGYKSAEADKIMLAAKQEYDDDKRAALYHQLQKLIHDDYPCCFLFNPVANMVFSDRFHNVNNFAPRPCYDISAWWVPLNQQKYREDSSP
jgi:peptide/nickel transport system substrate-binding protein